MNFTKLSVYISPSNDPYENLAFENQILSSVERNEKVLLFYSNAPSVVMGRFQNPWMECKLKKMFDDGVHLVRRQSGGGTVYHDHGNVNFCFMQATRDHLKDDNNQILINALGQLGICAEASGRSDLIFSESNINYKFSGSAFKQKKDRSFHHGTLLINSDLQKLNDYLIPKERKIEAKGIRSVRSKVINLSMVKSSINQKILVDAIVQSCQNYYQIAEVVYESLEKLQSQDQELAYLNSLKDWQWMFGETPSFTLEIPLNENDGICFLEVKKAVIEKCELEHSGLHASMLQELREKMLGVAFSAQAIREAIQKLVLTYPMFEKELQEIQYLLEKEIEL